jgi:hypothetical protein
MPKSNTEKSGELPFEARIEKYYDWCLSRIVEARVELSRNKAYVGNEDYFEGIRIRPVQAGAKLIKNLAENLNIPVDNEKYLQIMRKGKHA